MNQYGDFGKETEELMTICERNDRIPPELFKEFGVKRGLRDVDGTGALLCCALWHWCWSAWEFIL